MYEYKILETKGETIGDLGEILETMDALGDENWEAFAVSGNRIYFKNSCVLRKPIDSDIKDDTNSRKWKPVEMKLQKGVEKPLWKFW